MAKNENNFSYMTHRIGATTYKVKVVFQDTGTETMEDKILRIIRNSADTSGEKYDIILKESIRFRAGTKRTAYTKDKAALNVILSNCTKARDFSRYLYGSSIFPGSFQLGCSEEKACRIRLIFSCTGISGHATQAFCLEALKKTVWKRTVLSGSGITPSNLFHGRTSAFRTDTDVEIPDGFEQFRHGHACIALPEPLSALEPENDSQVVCPHTVVQETIVTDLLKAGWKHMHQETADEFRVAQCDLTFRFTGF